MSQTACSCGCGALGPKASTLAETTGALEQNEKTLRRWIDAGCPHHKASGARGRLTFAIHEVIDWMRALGRTGSPGRPVGGGRAPGNLAISPAALHEPPTGPSGVPKGDKLTPEDLHRLTAAANLAIKELEAKKRERVEAMARGELLEARAVEEAWAGEGQRVRGELEALPARLAPQLVGLDRPELEAQLAGALRGLLESLSKTPGAP